MLSACSRILRGVLVTLAIAAASTSALAMSFRLVPFDTGSCGSQCLQIIEGTGEIEQNSADRFANFVSQNLGRSRISTALVLHSPGGHVGGALRLGFILRELRATTIVGRVGSNATTIADGVCASACVYLFMGGSKRYVPAGSLLGVHAMADVPSPRDIVDGGNIGPQVAPEKAAEALREYVRLMGVNPAIVALGQETPHSSLHVLTPGEIARIKLGSQKLPR